MSKSKDNDVTNRRDFLKLASVSAPAAVAVATLTGTQALAEPAAEPHDGMQDTAHTRKYFETARF